MKNKIYKTYSFVGEFPWSIGLFIGITILVITKALSDMQFETLKIIFSFSFICILFPLGYFLGKEGEKIRTKREEFQKLFGILYSSYSDYDDIVRTLKKIINHSEFEYSNMDDNILDFIDELMDSNDKKEILDLFLSKKLKIEKLENYRIKLPV